MGKTNTLPGCIARFSHPLPPNGPCERCPWARLCRETAEAVKKRVAPILQKVEELEAWLKQEEVSP